MSAFVFRCEHRVFTAFAPNIATAKRMARKALSPARPGRWTKRTGRTLFAGDSGAPSFEWNPA